MNTISAEWVVGTFEGAAAKNIEAHAERNMGYIILERFGGGRGLGIVAVFRRVCTEPRPPHLEAVKDIQKIEKYERLRHG